MKASSKHQTRNVAIAMALAVMAICVLLLSAGCQAPGASQQAGSQASGTSQQSGSQTSNASQQSGPQVSDVSQQAEPQLSNESPQAEPQTSNASQQSSEAMAQAQAKLEEIRERGVLKVGTAGDYQPMSYLDLETGRYVGFDAELAEDLAADLGVGIEYVETSWPTWMDDTLAGKFDLAICGITVTDARKEQALMSDGYLENGKTVLCRSEDAGKYTSLEAINRPEVRVMENPGGLNEKFARENLPDATLIIHDVNQEIPGLVASGEADVMITETMEAGYYVGQDERLAAPLIYEPFTHGELGVLMPKGSEDLLDYVNEFLAKEKKSGRIDALAEEYIFKYREDDDALDLAA